MTKDQLYNELNYVNATRVSRLKYAQLIIKNEQLIKPLIDLLFLVDDNLSTRAAWIFEFVCKHDINLLMPYRSYFISNLSRLTLDSAIRPCAKIVELLVVINYTSKITHKKINLNTEHKTKLIAVCFDWLLTDKKVALKVHSMTVLYYLGTEFKWIHPELKTIIERDYNSHSAGYKAKSRHILKKLS